MHMDNDNKNLYFILFIFALFIIAGFFLVFNTIGGLQSDIKDLQTIVELNPQKTVSPTQSATSSTPDGSASSSVPPLEPAPSPTPAPTSGTITSIPAAIIFQATSSPTLLPQTSITVTVQSVSHSTDGTLTVNFKAYTNGATSYSAIDPSTIFQLIDSDTGATRTAGGVNGSFASMPPQSAVSGSVTFTTDPSQTSFILETGTTDTAAFYTFDFTNKTYKETPIG